MEDRAKREEEWKRVEDCIDSQSKITELQLQNSSY